VTALGSRLRRTPYRGTPPGSRKGPTARQRFTASEQFGGWAFATPATIIIVLFGAVPIVWTIVLSFQHASLGPGNRFVGAANYRQLAHDPVVRQAIGHTLVYTALFVPLTMIVGLLLAVAMNRKIRFISLYRTSAYVTMAVSTINEALIFLWLFDPSYGLVNWVGHELGLPQQQFLNSPSEALFVIVAMTVWGWTGFSVIIYLAALQGIPQTVLDAAAMDGASPWSTFRRVTVPLLSPASLFLGVWLTINALQLFDEVYVSTQGGPVGATTVIVYYIYQQGFQYFDVGYASAVALLLLLLTLVVTAVQFRVGRRYTHYRS
jgi:multiple sugar transport system permease protein